MTQKPFEPKDYEALCDFLIELNKCGKEHINWNWARFEWMYEHPMFDKSLLPLIGLWMDNGRIVGCAIYDMFLGEVSLLALPQYHEVYPEILDYAYQYLKDDKGLKVAVPDEDEYEIEAVLSAGYRRIDQSETIVSIDLLAPLPVPIKEGMQFVTLDPVRDYKELCYLFWQGFDHGSDREECLRQNPAEGSNRAHYNPYLNLTIEWGGKYIGHCSGWYSDKTDYVYIEPVCVIPEYRGEGVAKAMINELLNRANELGAKKAYVISDMKFYERLGFKKEKRYTFYQKGLIL